MKFMDIARCVFMAIEIPLLVWLIIIVWKIGRIGGGK